MNIIRNVLFAATLIFSLLGGASPAGATYVVSLVPETSLNLGVGDTVTVDVVLSGASDVPPPLAPSGDPIVSLLVLVGGYNPGTGSAAVQILGARNNSIFAKTFQTSTTTLGPDGVIGMFQVKGLAPGVGTFDLKGGIEPSSGFTSLGQSVAFGEPVPYTVAPAAVPEPSAFVLGAIAGVLSLGYVWRRHKAGLFP